MQRLDERAIASGVPDGKADPLFSRRIKRDAETTRAKGRLVRRAEMICRSTFVPSPQTASTTMVKFFIAINCGIHYLGLV